MQENKSSGLPASNIYGLVIHSYRNGGVEARKNLQE